MSTLFFQNPTMEVDEPDTTIPLVGDSRKGTSGFGLPLLKIYGKGWVGGGTIWISPIRVDIQNYRTRIPGGKFSSDQFVNNYVYSYRASIAVAVAEGPVNSVRAVRSNGKIVFDREYKYVSGVTFYSGSETQEPSSVLEAYEGVGNVPAFRGVSYIVFEDFEILLTQSPKRELTLPQFEFLLDGSRTTVHKYNHERASRTVNSRMYRVAEERGTYEPLHYSQFSDQNPLPIPIPEAWDTLMAVRSYADIKAEFQTLVTNNPDNVKIDVYGQSVLGEDMLGIRINDFYGRPIIGFSQGIHGDERDCHDALLYCADIFINNPTNDPVIEYMRAKYSIFIAATINPDGMNSGLPSTFGGNGSRTNNNNVNLNRNWPYFWDNASEADKGTSAASEPETYEFINWMTPHVSRVRFWLDIHGWNSRNDWGLLSEQIYHSRRAQTNHRGATLYPTNMLGKRDLTGVPFVYGEPAFTEFRSHHKPYLYTWVRNRAHQEAWCGLYEYPQKESVFSANVVFLDIFKGLLLAGADAIENEVGGFLVNPVAPAPMNNNSFLTTWNGEENRPDWYSVNGLVTRHFQATNDTDETRSFMRVYRPLDASWPDSPYSPSAARTTEQFVVIGGEKDSGATSTVNSEIIATGDQLLGSPLPHSVFHGAACQDGDYVYHLGGWTGSNYSSSIYRIPVPVANGRFRFWENTTFSLPLSGLQRHSAEVYGGNWVIVGGRSSLGYSPNVYKINKETGSTMTLATLSVARGWHTSCIIGSELYVFGGWTGSSTSTVCEKVNLDTGAVTPIASLPFSRAEQSLIHDPDSNVVYLIFGRSGSTYFSNIYQYDVAGDSMSSFVYSNSAEDDDEDLHDEIGGFDYSDPQLVGTVAYRDDAGDWVIVGGKYFDGTRSNRVWEMDFGTSTLYLRSTSVKRWGYVRPTTIFNGVEGDEFYATMSVRNADKVNDATNPYVRLVVYIGPLTNLSRTIKLGYTVPPQKDNNYQTYNIPFTLEAGETEFRIYFRLYSGGTTVDIGQLQAVKTQLGLVPTLPGGRSADEYEVLFREHINNPAHVNPGFKTITYWSTYYGEFRTREDETRSTTAEQLLGKVFSINGKNVGTNLQRATGIVSPLFGCQMDVSVKILDFICEVGLDLDAAELWYWAERTAPTVDPITGFSVYPANGRLYLKYRLNNVWHEQTIFTNIPLNHSKLNREYRGDLIHWSIGSWRGVITFDFYYYGAYSSINIAGGYPATNYTAYSFICYGARANGVGAVMRASRNLSAILHDFCLRAGIPENEIDTSAVNGAVTGYLLAKNTSFKAFIEPLRAGFMFDVIDGEKIRFITRGGSSVETFDIGDLISASDYPYKVTRTQEKELPNRVSINYIDEDRKFEQGTQYASRASQYGEGEISVSVPIAMTADQAAQVADRILYNMWTARVEYSFGLAHNKLYLDAGDIITITDNGKTFEVMLTDLSDRGDSIECKAVGVDGTVYNSNNTGDTGIIPVDKIALYKETDLYLLDLPLLQDTHESSVTGFYYAVSFNEDEIGQWSGARVDRSTDNGLTWVPQSGVSIKAAAGKTSSLLAPPAKFTFWDEVGTVIVVLTQGSLESKTKDDIIHNLANVALIGGEIIAFRDATLTGARTYTLTGLLRGLQGTEAAADAHTANDVFILLDPTTINRYDFGQNDLQVVRHYRAPTLLTNSDLALSVPFNNTGQGARPYSVTHVRATRNGSADIDIRWVRRNRIANSWNNGSDVPMSEITEAYELDIMSGPVVVRTVTTTGSSYIYSAGNQTTDFGSTQTSLTIRVYQMSGVVGRGHLAEETV